MEEEKNNRPDQQEDNKEQAEQIHKNEIEKGLDAGDSLAVANESNSSIENTCLDNEGQEDCNEVDDIPRVSLRELFVMEANKGQIQSFSQNVANSDELKEDTSEISAIFNNSKNGDTQNTINAVAGTSKEKKEDTRITLKELFERQQAKMEAIKHMEQTNEVLDSEVVVSKTSTAKDATHVMDEDNKDNINAQLQNGEDRSIEINNEDVGFKVIELKDIESKDVESKDIDNEVVESEELSDSVKLGQFSLDAETEKSMIKDIVSNILSDETQFAKVFVDHDTFESCNTQKETTHKDEEMNNDFSEVENEENKVKDKQIASQEILGNDSDILPDTFEELVAETPQWKPIFKETVQEIHKGTIVGAILDFYQNQQPDFKYPILNDDDKETTDFDIVDGIYVYMCREPFDHWHFVTNKLSDLYETLWDGPKLSGVGFELTFRLRKAVGEEEPPVWAINFVQSLAGYAYSSGNFMANGHVLSVTGITDVNIGNALKAITVVYDPQLVTVATDAGKREFLQVFGINVDEQLAMQAWNSLKVLEMFSKHIAMFITDPKRVSLMENTSFSKTVSEGINQEGSNTGVLFSENMRWNRSSGLFFKKFIIRMDSSVALAVKTVIRGRLPKGRDLIISGNECKLVFKPSPKSYAKMDADQLEVGISPKAYHDLMSKLSRKVRSFSVSSLGGVKIIVSS